MTRNDLTWRFPIWLAVLIATTAVLTVVYTCVTPFAAFAVIVAATLSWRGALSCTVLVWLANQAMGFGLLHYPPTGKTVAWGVVIGGAAVIGTLAAQWSHRRLRAFGAPTRTLGSFAAAFALYQLTLYAAAASVLGGTGTFSVRIIGQVLAINAATLVGLYGLQQLVEACFVLIRRRRAHASAARVA
ncbi:MAG TPA: hypothetical protein VK548_28640 [Candidatus Acidoferrum sp.]|nr:hypothetical protein [Candidatus Acidoferrum sp.]